MTDKPNLSDVAMEIIRGRRSIRRYSDQEVSDETIRLVLEAARWAPSGENSQGWRFIVIRDPATKKRINELATGASGRQFSAEYVADKMDVRFATLSEPEKRQRIFQSLTSGAVSDFHTDAPVLIAVCGRRNVWDLPFDNSAATQNMLLMAHALGLGTCWTISAVEDVRDEELCAELLGVPSEYKLITIVSLGYPAQFPNSRPRKPLDDLIHFERWGRQLDGSPKPPIDHFHHPSFDVTPGPPRSLPADYVNGLIFDLEKQFWIERGEGTRFRTPTIGWNVLEDNKDRLCSGKTVEGSIDVVRDFLVESSVVEEFGCALGNATVLEGSLTFSHVQTATISVRGCAHLSIERDLLRSGLEPYVCPCANAYAYAVRKTQGVWAELSNIKIDGDRCRVQQVLLLPKYIDGVTWS